MNIRNYITEESIKKIQERLNNEQYFCSENMKEELIKEMIDIICSDEKFQEFSEQIMKKVILG